MPEVLKKKKEKNEKVLIHRLTAFKRRFKLISPEIIEY